VEDQGKVRDDGVLTQARSAGVGASVAAFGTGLLAFGAVNAYFSGALSPPEVICGFVLLYLGASARKGKRGAMKACVWLSGLCLLGALLATGLVLSALLGPKDEVAGPRLGRLYFFLVEALVICVWSVVNIVWLFKVVKRTRELAKGGAEQESLHPTR